MKNVSKSVLVALFATLSMAASAQQVNTVYFLENAPMRHTFNPAFQPVSQGFASCRSTSGRPGRPAYSPPPEAPPSVQIHGA